LREAYVAETENVPARVVVAAKPPVRKSKPKGKKR
jgi:hypothetical protein